MSAPFLLFESGDISAFASLAELSGYVESPDLPRYVATDRTGRIVKLMSSRGGITERHLFTPVEKVTANVENDRMPESELKERLRTFLSRLSIETSGMETVEELVTKVIGNIGYTR